MAELDVTSLESVVIAAYASISGPAEAPRDWATFRSLFHPDARLMPTQPAADGTSTIEVLDADGYARSRASLLGATGFYEVEIGRSELHFGNVAHVFSAFESRSTPDGPPFVRGLNSFQLWWDGARWWIMSVLWDKEREGVTLPDSL